LKNLGCEWHRMVQNGKKEFKMVAEPMMSGKVFPLDVYQALYEYMQNPYASSCSDPKLMKVLHNYDSDAEWTLVDDIGINGRFKLKNGMEFTKLLKKRTRYQCREDKSGRIYLVPGVSKCKPLT